MSESALTPVIPATPEASRAVQRCYALRVAFQAQTSLRKDICAAKVLPSESLFAAVVVRSLQAAEAEVTERKQMCGVGAARFLCMQTTGEE